LNVLLTPPEPWQPELDGHQPGITPDPFAVYKAMALEGVDVTLLDPHRKPINPLFGLHPIYMGLDP